MYADLGDSWVPGLGNWMGDIVITETGNTGREQVFREEQEVRWGHGDPQVPTGPQGKKPSKQLGIGSRT